MNGQVLWSEETQVVQLAWPMYALATVPLVDQLSNIQDVTQVWYGDDATAAGSLTSIQKWCKLIESLGTAYGYNANDWKK